MFKRFLLKRISYLLEHFFEKKLALSRSEFILNPEFVIYKQKLHRKSLKEIIKIIDKSLKKTDMDYHKQRKFAK